MRPTSQAYADVLTPNKKLNSLKTQPSNRSKIQVNGSRRVPRGRSKIAASAGLSVSELIAEKIVDTEIVTANCRKNWPVMPPTNAQGTNTAERTSATAII